MIDIKEKDKDDVDDDDEVKRSSREQNEGLLIPLAFDVCYLFFSFSFLIGKIRPIWTVRCPMESIKSKLTWMLRFLIVC